MGVKHIVHAILGGAGSGKSTRLMELLRQSVKNNDIVMSLVPEQFSYEFDQKLYRFLGVSDFNRVETHSFKSLARAIFQRFGSHLDGVTYADDMTKYALLYQTVLFTNEHAHMLQILGKQCHHASFLDELNQIFTRFRRNGITAAMLYDSCASLSGRLLEKTMDLFHLYQNYDKLLADHHLKDTETDLTEAAAIANGQDAFLGATLYIDEFESFTEDEYQMLRVLLASCKDVYIALRTDEAEMTPYSLLSTVNDTLFAIKRIASDLRCSITFEHCKTPYRFHSNDLIWLNQHIFRHASVSPDPMQNLHVLEASSPNEEADYACTTIRRLLADHPSLRCRDIVILTNQFDAYQNVLEAAMERYDIPCHFDCSQPICYLPLIQYLQTLFELLHQKRLDTELLLRLGKSGLTACSMEEIAELENYCYTWQIDGDTWNQPFNAGNSPLIEQIRQKLVPPLQGLKEKCRCEHTGFAYCQMLYDFLDQQKVKEKLNNQLLSIENESDRQNLMEEWAFAWNSWIDILDRMSNLYATFSMQISEFCSILSLLLQRTERAVPPKTLDAVLIADGNTTRLNAPKVVFLLGLCEGAFPTSPVGDAIFSERDCAIFEQINLPVTASKETQLADAQFSAYKLLSSASDALYLLYPRIDLMQQKCYPSTVVNQIKEMFPNDCDEPKTCAAFGCAYYATTLPAVYYQYVQNYTLHSSDTRSMEQVLLQHPFYQKRLKSLEQIAVQHAEQADAPLYRIENPELMQAHLGSTLQLSASSLERYQLCPFSYFCQDILRLTYRTKMQLSGAGSGNLVHYCLEQLLKVYSREEFLTLSPETMDQNVKKYAADFWKDSMGGDFSKSGREIAVYEHMVGDLHQLVLRLQEEFQHSSFYPKYLELPISPDNPDFPPLELEAANGKKIRLIGKVDRVDFCQDGDRSWVRVVDYKTGEKNFSFGDLLYGLDLQMLIYLFTITSPHTALAQADPAGVLYMPSGKIRSDLPRGSDVLAQKQYYDTYRMNGVLLRNPHVMTLMESDGRGLYIPGKQNAAQQIVEGSGTFLSEQQMQHLCDFVFNQLKQTADQIYRGSIDAYPLSLQDYDGCAFCAYANICGNADHCHARHTEGTQIARERQMLQLLCEEGEEI